LGIRKKAKAIGFSLPSLANFRYIFFNDGGLCGDAALAARLDRSSRQHDICAWRGGLAEDAPTPLEVLLTTMHLRWQEGKWDEAVALAKAAAPYLHAKAAYGREFRELGALRDEQLDELCAHLSGSGGTAAAEGTED
jgi:hypothetical protein